MSDAEVRYHLLRPGQISARRQACPVAYVPLGTLEWHGRHNPVGLDGLQAEGLAVLCAQRGGGVAFPTLYYGESRAEGLLDTNPAHIPTVAADMGLPPEKLKTEHQPFSPTQQVLGYQRLLLHILAEVESLGFAVGVLVAGHAPLVDHARAAATVFNKRVYSRASGLLAWACMDHLLVMEQFPDAGDHAGGWETSHMLALHPQTVDMTQVPPPAQGAGPLQGNVRTHEASAEFGWKTLEAAAAILVREARDRLEHREFYLRHGCSMVESRWKR